MTPPTGGASPDPSTRATPIDPVPSALGTARHDGARHRPATGVLLILLLASARWLGAVDISTRIPCVALLGVASVSAASSR